MIGLMEEDSQAVNKKDTENQKMVDENASKTLSKSENKIQEEKDISKMDNLSVVEMLKKMSQDELKEFIERSSTEH